VGDERFRLFCALQLPAAAVERLVAWQVEHLPGAERAPVVRVVPAANLHVTLAFLGSRPAADVPRIAGELAQASLGSGRIELRPDRYRETRSVGMIVLADVEGAATALAQDVGQRLERLGLYRRESQSWLPHVTVLRFRQRPGLAPPVAGLEPIGDVRCALYRSALGPDGARYDVLESVGLGGR
jgi:RNA 2',3'-cyclic 3'-phosphodiesterase